MPKLIPECPACGTRLQVTTLHCQGCGMELRNDFELSPFDLLTTEQADFLWLFLKHRGNLSAVQGVLGLSYPTVKAKLDDLLMALGVAETRQENLPEVQMERESETVTPMSNCDIDANSIKASDIIKRKLMENNGKAIVRTVRGLPCKIHAAADGVSFLSDKLPINPPFRFEVFDVIVDFLISQNGRAKKGNGRNHKLGEPDCDETTVVGAIGYYYTHAESGKSVYDPVFVLAAVLEWANIARNERGELVLTASYQEAYRASIEGDG